MPQIAGLSLLLAALAREFKQWESTTAQRRAFQPD
jgi:hypothetical protein